jgi:hypothetical protein
MTFRRGMFILGASFIAIILVAVAWLLAELFYRPSYDRAHPDHDRYAGMFHRLEMTRSQRRITSEDPIDPSIDLSELNGGHWKVACVFGGYTTPVETMRGLGAHIDENDLRRFTEAGRRGFRLAPVEESEMAIAYVDLADNARFIHFRHGIGPEGQNFQKCIARPETRLRLPMP